MIRSSLQIGVNKLKKWWDDDEKVLRNSLPFQRHAGVWSVYTKSNLIWSMLEDSFIPAIVLLKDKAGVDGKGKDVYIYEVLDGLQRLSTVFSFIEDGFALHSAVPSVNYDGFDYDIAGKKYSELEEELQSAICQYRFIIQCLENCNLVEAESLFFSINSGVALSAIQKAKPRMGTELIKFFTGLLEGHFFTQAVNMTEAQAKREDDLLMLLQSALLLDNRHEGREYKSISAANCFAYAESIRGSYNGDKQTMIADVIHYLDKAFTAKNKFLGKNNVPVVVVLAKIAIEQMVGEKTFAGFVNMFANGIYPSYKEASGSGNIKTRQVQMRLRVMFLAFCKHFELNAEEIKKPFADDIPLYDGLLAKDGLLPEHGGDGAGVEREDFSPGERYSITDAVMEDMEHPEQEAEPISDSIGAGVGKLDEG